MTDNVIWGTDFKGQSEAGIPASEIMDGLLVLPVIRVERDTTPSDYTAPTDDCA